MRALILAAVAAGTVIAAGPALADTEPMVAAKMLNPDRNREVMAAINRLDADIARAEQANVPSRQLAAARAAATRIHEDYRTYGRDGLGRDEVRRIEQSVAEARAKIPRSGRR